MPYLWKAAHHMATRMMGGRTSVLLKLVPIAVLACLLWPLVDWALLNAVWTTPDGTSAICASGEGACWAVIDARWRLILFGLYPHDEQWRSLVACLAMLGAGALSCIPIFWTPVRLVSIWIAGFLVFYFLMRGGVLGLTLVYPEQWGGLALTVFIYASGLLIGMPVAVCLTLMRRSRLPVISHCTGAFIDTVRSLPLVATLFTFAVVLPFVLPDFIQGDKLTRVILGFALFYAAYQAEIIRAGIQAIPYGQEEAATALGLGYFRCIAMVVLPQAFRIALPPTISQIVITFKETSLVVVIGFFDILASGNAAFGTGEWAFAYKEVYVFVGLIYFTFIFALSRYGMYLERRMGVART